MKEPRFRQGKSVPENVYDMCAQPHKPIMTAPSKELAESYVRMLNMGAQELWPDEEMDNPND